MDQQNSSACVNVLLGISKNLAQCSSIQKTLEEICAHVERYFSPKHLAFLLVEPSTGDVAFNYVIGHLKEQIEGRKLRKGKGIAGWVAETGDPLLIEDTSQDPRFDSQFLTSKTKEASSIMAVPLKSGDVVYGILEIFDNRSGTRFSKSDLIDFMAIADVTAIAIERSYYFQAMRRMAETDQLTGLPNKRTFDRYMEREIEICKRYGTPSTVLELHLDGIRKLNEEYGISAVDKILQQIASIATEEVRKVDVACRIASNRIAIIMPNTEKKSAMNISQRIQAKTNEQRALLHLPAFSITHTIHSGIQDDVSQLLKISEMSKVGTQGFKKYRNVAANLFLLLAEEKQSHERRQYYRKKVQLAGRYDNPESQEAGDILLENLSLNGLGFTTLLMHSLNKGDLIRLAFKLDDARGTEVNRLGRIRYIRDRYIGCQFADQKSYDSDLGFYLMR